MSNELVPQKQELVEVQPERIINVWNQRDRTQQEVHTSAKTWGEFKDELEGEINFTNIRGVIRHSSNILEVDGALLPEESFSMFLFPQKVKSGMRTRSEYEKTFPTAKALRKECVRRGLGSSGSKKDFLDRLVKADKEEQNKKPIVTKPPIKTKSAAKTSSVESSLAKVEEPVFPAIIEKATVTTEMTLRITDKDALSSLLATQFPGMDVIEIDAIISMKATLGLGAPIAPKKELTPETKIETPSPKKAAPIKAPLPPARADVKKDVKRKVHELPSEDVLKSEADRMAKDFL